jgi:hypothetical protein
MTMRDRMLAVIRKEEHDGVPFVQYDGLAGPNEEIWDAIGKDKMGVLRWCRPYRFEHPNCRIEREEISLDGHPSLRNTLITPEGNLTELKPLIPGMGGVVGFLKHYVQTVDDYDVLSAYLRDITVVPDPSVVQQAIDDFGEAGLPHVALGRTPFQQLWIQWTSIMDLSGHRVDAPHRVQNCVALMGSVLDQVTEAVLHCAEVVDVPYVVIGDNITAPMIGEERFVRYCTPYYDRVADRMADKDIPLFVHMDGDLKPPANAIGASRVAGIDSLSPPPDNDTSVEDALSLWPDMPLLVNFPSSVHLADSATIYEQAARILEEGGHSGRIQIQISENTPPDVWRKSYPPILQAIADFGAP